MNKLVLDCTTGRKRYESMTSAESTALTAGQGEFAFYEARLAEQLKQKELDEADLAEMLRRFRASRS